MVDLQAILIFIGILIGSMFLCFLLAIVFSKVVLNMIRGPLNARIAAQYPSDAVLLQDLTANSFGRELAGQQQIRGNGGLVLSQTQLHFFQFVPLLELRIPLDTITNITLTKSHRGKTTLYDLLKIHFTSNGQTDAVAWYVADPQAWKTQIEMLKTTAATEGLPNVVRTE
jgi:hypothetical protein